MNNKNNYAIKLTTLCIFAAMSGQLYASGYHFGAQSVSALATANSNAAEAADPSTIFHNPAGLTKLPGLQVTGNAIMVMPSVKYSNATANYFDGRTINGQTHGKITDDFVFVPQLYASYQINDRLTAGLGLYVPFASATEYDTDSVLRYNINKTELISYNINPTLAFKINDKHSIAAGVIAQYSTAELRQFANFGPFAKQPYSQPFDGYANVKGNDWGFGYNLGWLWDINDHVRVGLNYRSKIDHTLEGHGEWHLTGDAFKNPALEQGVRHSGYVAKEDASVKIQTPESLSMHGMFKIDPKWTLFGDVTWTRHSRFNELNIQWEVPKIVADPQTGKQTMSDQTIVKPDWKDTWKFSLGTAYQITDPLQLRFGFSYDQAPVRSADKRLSTMPDKNRKTITLGAKYDLSKNSTLNFAYAYMWTGSTTADVNGWCGGGKMGPGSTACVSTRTDGHAKFKSDAHMFGLQYTHRF